MDTPPVIPDLTLLRRIGAGSYGDVWIARTLTGVYRAVKVVDRARFSDDRPFQRELEGISRFQRAIGDQPRQLALMHVGRIEPQGLLYYVMELADDVLTGTDIDPDRYEPLTLKSLRAHRSVLPAAECVRLGVELARGLAGLHAAGLIHRDVKPSNIILVNGVPKLADIGLVSSREASVTSLGTPGYSPPEGAGSLSADLWGLGRILYELVTGLGTKEFPRLPPGFDQRPDSGVLLELNEVVLRACELEPVDRYATAQHMLDDLLLIQAGRSVKDLNRVRARLKSVLRFTGVAAAIAAAVIAGLGVQNYFALRKISAQDRAARAQAEQDERLARYAANLHVAQLAYNSGDYGLARATLRREIPAAGAADRRGLEWHALWNETAGEATRVWGDVGSPPLLHFVVSPDGQSVAAVEGGTRIVSFDLAAGTRRVLSSQPLYLGSFTTDGMSLIVATPESTLHLLNLASGELSAPLVTGFNLVVASPDRHTVLLRQRGLDHFRLSLWDTSTQSETAVWDAEPALAAAEIPLAGISPDHRLLVMCVVQRTGVELSYELRGWDFSTRSYRFQRRFPGPINTFSFSPDGTRLVVGGTGWAMQVLDTADGRVVREMVERSGTVFRAVFTPDGQQIVAAGREQRLQFWNLATGAPVVALRGHEGAVTHVGFSGSRLFSTGDDGTLREWDFPAQARVVVRAGFWNRLLGDPRFAPDGSYLAATLGGGQLVRVDARTLEPADRPWDAFLALGFAAEGLRALNRERELVVIDPAAGTTQTTGLRLEEASDLLVTASSTDTAASLFGFRDGRVVLWDGAARRAIALEQRQTAEIWAVAVSKGGRWAAAGDRAGVVCLWQTTGGAVVREIPSNGAAIFHLAFSPDEQNLVVNRGNGMMTVLNLDAMHVQAERLGHVRGCTAAVFSPEGGRLITAGMDGLIAFWSVPEYRQLGVLTFEPQSTERVYSIAELCLSADGRQLVAFTGDGRLRRWELLPSPTGPGL